MNRLIQSLLSGLLLTALASPANASATFTVNNVADSVDINPGDGVCRDFHGQCSLRAAVMEANALAGADIIEFDPSIDGQVIRLTLHGTGENQAATGDLDITDDLTIIGNGETKTLIDGDAADRVFQIINGTTTTLKQLTVRNGGGVSQGAGIWIYSGSTLNLYSVHVTDNHASGSSTVYGGGIEADGDFGAKSSTISNNSANGVIGAYGGGLTVGASSPVSIVESTIANNTASSATGIAAGGGIDSTSVLTLQDSIVRGNTAHSDSSEAYGAGISVTNNNSSLTLLRVEVSGNTAEAHNGMAFGGGIESGYPTTLVNTTVAGNRATTGGGIEMDGALLTLVNATISGNTSGIGGGVALDTGAMVKLDNTLIAGNSGTKPDCYDNGAGAITSLGYNLIGNTTGCTIASTMGDQFGTDAKPIDPKLGPLSDLGAANGTRVLPLLAGSPAIDKADPQLKSQGGTCVSPDQLGTTRPVDGNGDGTATCDIGAYERGLEKPPSASDGSLSTDLNTAASGALKASDPNGDALTFSIAAQPAHGAVAINDASKGTFTYTPAQGYSGSDSFTFTATDGLVASNTATESVTVKPTASGGGGAFGGMTLIGLALLAIRALRRKPCQTT